MRVKHKVWVNTARDSSMKDLVYGPSEDSRLVQTDSYEQWGGGSFTIAAAANEDLNLGDVDAVRGIYLEAAGDLEITLNGSDTPLTLHRPDSQVGTVAKLFAEAEIDTVNVANPGTAAVSGHFHVYGDAS